MVAGLQWLLGCCAVVGWERLVFGGKLFRTGVIDPGGGGLELASASILGRHDRDEVVP